MTLRIKDWKKFQHFKDRKPPWVKLYRDLLDDIEWHELDPVAAKTLVMLWLIASENYGDLPDLKKLAFRLRVSEKSLESTLTKLDHWLEQTDITPISERYQSDSPETERETELETETEKIAPKRKCQIPDNFFPDETGQQKAADSGISIDTELDRFKDFHKGRGNAMLDWQAAWRTWVGNAVKFAARSPPRQTARESTIDGLTGGRATGRQNEKVINGEAKRIS